MTINYLSRPEVAWEISEPVQGVTEKRATANVAGLGKVEIYFDKGWACDINNTRAWSAIRGSFENAQSVIKSDIWHWSYIEKFRNQ